MHTKFLLDSGNPDEYQELISHAEKKGYTIWGATTNPTLIAKNLGDKKYTRQEAFQLQKDIILDILQLVQGSVSAEVYADKTTTAIEMTEQGEEIATWDKRITIKLPTTYEGFKARSNLRRKNIPINNTLVFSQEQILAILLHEQLMISRYGKPYTDWQCCISPFLGRLDDKGINGIELIGHAVRLKTYFPTCEILEASVRSSFHITKGIEFHTDLITAPYSAYMNWFSDNEKEVSATPHLQPIPPYIPSEKILAISSEEAFFEAITTTLLPITHPLTDTGVDRFAADWNTILI